jgi:SAM-dependent methyltransferase
VSGGGVWDFLAIIRNSFPGVAYFAKNAEFGQGRFWDSFLAKAARTGRYGELWCADASRLPFADEQFQTVLAVSVMEHLPQPARVLAEVFRVLRPGGRFVATIVLADLHEYLFYPRLLRHLGAAGLARWYCRLQDRLFRHHSLLSRSQWQELFRAAGFQTFGARPIVTPQLTASWDRLLLSALPYRIGLPCGWHPAWFRRTAVHCYRDSVRQRFAAGSNLLVIARKSRRPHPVSKTRPPRALRASEETVHYAFAHV